MGLAMFCLFLPTANPFTVGNAELREAMTGAKGLLVAAVYVLSSLYGQPPTYF